MATIERTFIYTIVNNTTNNSTDKIVLFTAYDRTNKNLKTTKWDANPDSILKKNVPSYFYQQKSLTWFMCFIPIKPNTNVFVAMVTIVKLINVL